MLSKHSTTNSRNWVSPRVWPEMLIATLRFAGTYTVRGGVLVDADVHRVGN